MPQHQPTHPVLLWLQLQLKITTATLNTTIFIKQLALQYFHVSWYVCCIHCWDNLLYVNWQFDCHMHKFSHAFGKYTSTDANAISSNLSLTLQLLSVLQTLIIKLVSALQLKLQLRYTAHDSSALSAFVSADISFAFASCTSTDSLTAFSPYCSVHTGQNEKKKANYQIWRCNSFRLFTFHERFIFCKRSKLN